MNNKVLKNLKSAFIAQFISIFFSLIMYLILPKIIGSLNYSYWQLFLFYTNYAGFFHLGLIDGVYLRLGGKKYEELKFDLLGTQMKIMSMFHLVIGSVFSIFVILSTIMLERKIVLIVTVFYIVLYCVENFLAFCLQAVNLVKKYSIAIILEKSFCLLITCVLLFLKINDYKYYIITYTLSKIINILYLIFNTKEIVFSKIIDVRCALKEIKLNIKIGIILMISGIAGALIIGNGRLIIDNIWGIEMFGKISFSISILNMILLFIKQISVVLFPALRQEEKKNIVKLYVMIKNVLDIILPIMFVFYVPGKIVLEMWLPEYKESLKILALTMPICLYDARMQILGATYLKVMRKEKALLIINVIAMILSFSLVVFFGYITKNIEMIIISMVFAIAMRSALCEIYLNSQFNMGIKEDISSFIKTLIISSVFMIISWWTYNCLAFLLYIVVYLVYLFSNRNKVKCVYNYLKVKRVEEK